MSRRRNPFTILGRLRSIDERIARTELATASESRRRAQERLDHFKQQYREQTPVEERLTPGQLMSLRLRGIKSHEQLVEAANEYERTDAALEERTDRWRSAAADLDAAERMEARVKERQARDARLAAERALDDLFSMLHGGRERDR